ncbi:MAG: phosphohistidine phosphatase SixA [Candidatus Hadarchaeales archaeon]
MKVYLVQHAEAKREEEDPARPLSERGREQIRRVCEFLRGKGIRVAKILHSGKLRARQTAEELARVIDSREGLKEADGLAPLDDPGIWAERLAREQEDLMLVGHLPHLEMLAGLLLTGSRRKVVGFRMGGIVCLSRDAEGGWSLEWAITPDFC